MQINRQIFYPPEKILDIVKTKLKIFKDKNIEIDYITFVADGEPTLDKNLGKTLEKLKIYKIKTAVITNASLITDETVKDDLNKADWVSLKVDSIDKDIWKKINRPHKNLKFEEIKQNIVDFSEKYKGFLATETMLIKDYNDKQDSIIKTIDFIEKINPDKSYISTPTRPPAEKQIKSADDEIIIYFYQNLTKKGLDVETLNYYEGDNFEYAGGLEREILNILSVHPMKKQAIKKLLEKENANWKLVKKLVDEKKINEIKYKDSFYYKIKNYDK